MAFMTPQTPEQIAGKVQTCADCQFLRTFKAREDERERYGYITEFGYGCTKPGYEGYTQLISWCPSFQVRAILRGES